MKKVEIPKKSKLKSKKAECRYTIPAYALVLKQKSAKTIRLSALESVHNDHNWKSMKMLTTLEKPWTSASGAIKSNKFQKIIEKN